MDERLLVWLHGFAVGLGAAMGLVGLHRHLSIPQTDFGLSVILGTSAIVILLGAMLWMYRDDG